MTHETTTTQRALEAGSRLVKGGVHAAFRLATENGFVKAIHLGSASRAGSLATQDVDQRFSYGNPRAVVIVYRDVRVSCIVLSGWPNLPDSARKGIRFHEAFCIAQYAYRPSAVVSRCLPLLLFLSISIVLRLDGRGPSYIRSKVF
jgi:hypothetical protein